MLGAEQGHRWKVEDLTGDDRGDRSTVQVVPPDRPGFRGVGHGVVGMGALGEVVTRIAGLLALLLPRTDPAGLGSGLGIAVRRWRLDELREFMARRDRSSATSPIRLSIILACSAIISRRASTSPSNAA